jgi:hypothetical protein
MTAALREDRIEIGVMRRNDAVAALDITARRPIGIGRFAQGKSGEAVTALVPRLFALCAAAQGAAADNALAAARGLRVPPGLAAAQTSAVLAERLVELLRGTITLLGGDESPAVTSCLRELIAAARRFDPAGLLDDDAIATIERGLGTLGLGAGCLDDDAACRRWLGSDSLLATLYRPLLLDAGFGAVAVDPLRAAEDDAIGDRLMQHGLSFAVRPDLDGRVPETGPLARNAGHPLIAAFGTGLGGRLLARLIEIRATPHRLRELRRGDADPAAIVQSLPLGRGIGLGAVECARGRLHHLIALDAAGLIRSFEVLAPTEWNFHPRGPIARALIGAALRDTDADRGRIERLIAAFDPCVGFDVRFREAADA